LDKKVYRLKPILTIGLYLLDCIKYRFDTNYDRKLLSAIIETSGPKQAQYLLKIHWSNKITHLLSAILFGLLIGVFSKPDTGYLFFCFCLLGGAFFISDKELFDRVKKRRNAIRTGFPDFANKLVLLINAGMTVTRAWERISSDRRKDTPLHKEVCMTIQDIRGGKPEHSAYEEFAKRCRTPEITRFISVILQNIRKGNAELVPVLRVLTNDCWEMRKNIAKRFGEEASTKMLLPLMLMFLAILLIVGTPAVLALRSL
jgi:Flp pilus assembly protein TadC